MMVYKRSIGMNVEVYKMPEEFKALVHVSGIYFLIRNGEIDYIGKSTNIQNRLSSHRVFNRNQHEEVWVLPIPYKERWKYHYIEYDLIREFKPSHNIHGITR